MQGLIYVADDEKNIRDLIKSFLEEQGYTVKVFENGDLLLEEHEKQKADLIILDVMMPGTDGFSICSALRKKSDVPIFLLTARGADADYITGFTLGCDDYFTKPFSPLKLTMRVNAIFKRIINDKNKEDDILCFGDIKLIPDQKLATCKNNEIKLTNKEYKLISYMMQQKEKAVSRKELLDVVWGYDMEVETRVTDDTIKRLRKKLREYGSNISIETIYGFGFKLNKKE